MRKGRNHVGRFILVSGLLLVFLTAGNAPAATSIASAIQELDIKGQSMNGAACLRHADEYLRFAGDEAVKPAEKLLAIQSCIQYLYSVRLREKLEEAVPKAHEAFELYRRSLTGTDLIAERTLVANYTTTFLQGEIVAKKERLEECLKVIDENEKALNSDPADIFADLLRGKLCTYANAWDKAAPFLEKYISESTKPNSEGYVNLAAVYSALDRPGEALAAVEAGMKHFESSPDTQALLAGALPGILTTGKIDDAKVIDLLPYYAQNGHSASVALAAVAQRKLMSSDIKVALQYAKLAYDQAPIDEIEMPVVITLYILAAADTDMTRVNHFMEYQKHGAASSDGNREVADVYKNPFEDVSSPLSPAVIARLNQRLTQTMPTEGAIYERMRDRGALYLAMGKYPEALRSYQSAYAAASIRQAKEASGLVPRVLKAIDGSIYRANQYLEYQKYGAAGPAGQQGAKCALVNPLANERIPPLPVDVDAALRAIATTPGYTAKCCESRGTAFLALGEYAEGLEQMRSAYALTALDPDALARAVENIAAVIKAYDGSLARANQYLEFQRFGAAGPDGKLDTAHALTNPLPEIIKELTK